MIHYFDDPDGRCELPASLTAAEWKRPQEFIAAHFEKVSSIHCFYIGWWRGVVGSAFQMKRSYSTPGPGSTAMGDCLRAGKPSRYEACQLGRLNLLPSVGR